MLRVFERFMEKLAADWEKTRAFMRQIKTEFHEEIASFDEVPRTYDVEFEPITAISHDAPVLSVAASKKSSPVDFSKLKGAKLRQAYRRAFQEEPDGRWSEETIRGYLKDADQATE